MPYLLILAFLSVRVLSSVTAKKNGSAFSSIGIIGSLLFTLETGLFSLFYYWAFNGFTLNVNLAVTVYSMIYGAIVVANLIPSIFMYNYGSITTVNFISSTVSLIATVLFGMILFGEELSADKILRILLMLACVAIIFIGAKKNESMLDTPKKKGVVHYLAILLPTVVALMGAFSTILLKRYMTDPAVTDANTYYFMTNLFCVIYAIPIILGMAKKQNLPIKDICLMCYHKRSLGAFAATTIGSVQQLIVTALIVRLDVMVYTPLTSALGFIALAIATPIVREKLDRYAVAATAVAVSSIVLPALIFA